MGWDVKEPQTVGPGARSLAYVVLSVGAYWVASLSWSVVAE